MANTKTNLEYKQANRKGVLGTLEGICADCIHATRNERLYPNSVWKKAFTDPLVQEQFKAGGIFGQLGHPKEGQSENEEFNSIAICMPEPPVEGPDGKLRGRWDILDTPSGRILKCLCDYGYKIGISSRANGDLITDYNGNESVDPETFEFKAFDAVLLPAVKSARLNLITESVDKNRNFKKALQESINNSNDVDKEIMYQVLESLGIDYKNSSETKEETEDKAVVNTDAAASYGADIVNQLQVALQENNNLQLKNLELNEQLSAASSRERKLQEQVAKLRTSLRSQSSLVKATQGSTSQLLSLRERLETNKVEQEQLTESYKAKITSLKKTNTELQEKLNSTSKIVNALQYKIKTITSDTVSKQNQLIESLKTEVTQLKQDSQLKHSQYTKKLEESNKLVNKYKNTAKLAVDKYINCKATMLGIPSSEIKNKLTESFSFSQIDSICESLKNQYLNFSTLPFELSNVKKVEMKENLQHQITNPDDVVDKSILEFIN